MMKNGVNFILTALLVAELFKILIYANYIMRDVSLDTPVSRPLSRLVCLSLTVKSRCLLEWILQIMVRHFVTHKQLQADKRHSI